MLIPKIMATMRDWLKGPDSVPGRVVVVHCKAGKGRSGTIACSYLISQENWKVKDALTRFTERRMRSGFGPGISIPSQQRWIRYVENWANHGKVYVDRPIEILELHAWGLRDGVRIAIEGYIEDGKIIHTFHSFTKEERTIMDDPRTQSNTPSDLDSQSNEGILSPQETPVTASSTASSSRPEENGLKAVLFRPSKQLIIPNSDINIDVEKRNKATYGFTMVTSVAHVWFNTFFESQPSFQATKGTPPEPTSHATDPQSPGTVHLTSSGVFTIDWDAMDGIRGSAKKGTRALDRLSVVWRAAGNEKASTGDLTKIVTQPQTGEVVQDSGPADWKNANPSNLMGLGKSLGLRAETPDSPALSKASSAQSSRASSHPGDIASSDIEAGVKTHGPKGEDHVLLSVTPPPTETVPAVSVTGPEADDMSMPGTQQTTGATIAQNENGTGKVTASIEGIKELNIKDHGQEGAQRAAKP